MSRMVVMPAPMWQQDELVTLKPNETKGIALSADKRLPANSMISVSLREADSSGNTPPAATASQGKNTATPAQISRVPVFINPGVAS